MTILAHIDDAVFIQNYQVKTTSLKVADIFGKRHTHILEKITNLDCSPEFASANFSAHMQTIQAGAVQRESKYYEMTKDGFIFLVMGFTGAAAAKIKEAYINAFNRMAHLLQQEQPIDNDLKVGMVVQLVSGGPQMNISQLLYNDQGSIEHAEVIWFYQNRLYKEHLPIACLLPMSCSKHLQQFWKQVYQYGLHKLNHSRHAHIIALNLSQLYDCIPDLPQRNELTLQLKASAHPFPQFMEANKPAYSVLDGRIYRCYLFRNHSLALNECPS